MSRPLLTALCLLNTVPIACQNRGAQVEPTPEARASAAPNTLPESTLPESTLPKSSADVAPSTVPPSAPSAGANPAPSAGVSERIDELARLVQLPVRPAAVFWQRGLMGKNEKPEVPGPADGFLIAVLSYAPADADRLVAAQSGPASRSDVATAPWFPAGLLALAHPNADGVQVLSGSRYVVAASNVRAPFAGGAIHRIGTSGWFVLVLSTS